MLTNKENYMRVLHREIPESIPLARYMTVYPYCLRQNRNDDWSGFDYFGVEYVTSKESGFAAGFIPKPGQFMIDDITKWRDIVKIPNWDDVDWEAMAEKDLKKYDRSKAPLMSDSVTGFFQGLINFMGFTEGLCACYEEPEEVKAMMETLCDYHVGVAKKIIKYYKPDALWLPDDVCTARAPFVSKEMFEDLFLPYWKRYTEVWLDAGIPAQLHCCGACDLLLDDFVDCGFSAWEAQAQNDVRGLKARHGNKMAVVGGFNVSDLLEPTTTEEEVRSATRSYLTDMAPGGGLIWMGAMFFGDPNTPRAQRAKWVNEEFENLRTAFYK